MMVFNRYWSQVLPQIVVLVRFQRLRDLLVLQGTRSQPKRSLKALFIKLVSLKIIEEGQGLIPEEHHYPKKESVLLKCNDLFQWKMF